MKIPLASCTLPAAPAEEMVHGDHWIAASQAHGYCWLLSLHPSCPSCLVLLRPAQSCSQSQTAGWAVPAWPLCVSLEVTHALCPPKSWRGDIPETCVRGGIPRHYLTWEGPREPEGVQAEPCQTPPQHTAGGEPGGPRKPSLLKSGCCIYFPLLAARRGSPSQPLIVVSAS